MSRKPRAPGTHAHRCPTPAGATGTVTVAETLFCPHLLESDMLLAFYHCRKDCPQEWMTFWKHKKQKPSCHKNDMQDR